MTCQIPEQIENQNAMLPCYSEPLRPRLPPASGGTDGDCAFPYPFSKLCSALWRGYVGQWNIENNRLFLVALEGTCPDGAPASLTTIFPDHNGPIFADWYTGDLHCARGKVIGQIDGFYLNVYEEDVVMRILAGVVIGTEVLRNEMPAPTADIDEDEDRW